jgi:opacity protein-like surface antigen
MKTKLLLTATVVLGFSDIVASGWNGFYVRTDLALVGAGNSHKENPDALLAGKKEGASERLVHLGVAGGWGRVFGGSFYGGIDATLLGMSGVMSAAEENKFSFLYDPKITVRLGFARCNMMVYAGGGAGALYAFTDTSKLQGHHAHFPKNKEGKNELLWTWHARVGADFKIKGNWMAGVFYEYQRSFSHKNEGEATTLKREDLSLVSDRLAFVFGYQM